MQSIQCLVCKHYLGDKLCAAFPSVGIPQDIWTGQFDHRQEYPNQEGEGILFEQDPAAPEDPTLEEEGD